MDELGPPALTAAPGYELVDNLLGKRQLGFGGWAQTCGRMFTEPDISYVCDDTAVCVTGTRFNAVQCCATTDLEADSCFLQTSCYASTDFSRLCTGECLSSTDYARICTHVSWTECVTQYFFNGPTRLTGFYCDTAESTFSLSLYYAYSSAEQPTETTSRGVIETPLPSPSSPTASTSTPSNPVPAPAATSAESASQSGGGSSGLSEGAIVAIAVCVSIVGLALIATLFFIMWKKRRNGGGSAAQAEFPKFSEQARSGMVPSWNNMKPGSSSPMLYHSGGGQAYRDSPESFDHHFGPMDDDAVARMRRLSNAGTMDYTMVARTNDDFRPQVP